MRASILLPLVALLAGCVQSPAAADAVTEPAASMPTRTLSFEREVRLTQFALPLTGGNLPLDESCLRILVPRGWVPLEAHAIASWEAQSPAAHRLQVALFDHRSADPLAIGVGPSPASGEHAWTAGQQARWRNSEGHVAVLPWIADAGALVHQAVLVNATVTFAIHPGADDVPHVVPCFDLGVL